jgi:hypothetical protein
MEAAGSIGGLVVAPYALKGGRLGLMSGLSGW